MKFFFKRSSVLHKQLSPTIHCIFMTSDTDESQSASAAKPKPYTHDQLAALSDKQLLELYDQQSPRLYPFCLIGMPLEDARRQYQQWARCKVSLLVSGRDASLMDMRTCEHWCVVDGKDRIVEFL